HGNMAWPLRSIAEALREGLFGRLVVWVVVCAALLSFARFLVRRAHRVAWGTRATTVSIVVASLAGVSGLVHAFAGRRTNLEVDLFARNKTIGMYEPATLATANSASGEVRYAIGDALSADSLDLVWIASGVHDLPEGTPIARVEVDYEGGSIV